MVSAASLKKIPYFGGWKKYSSETALWLNTAEFRRSFAFFYHIEIARRMNKNPKSLLLSRTSRNNFKMHAGAAEGEGEAKRTKDVSSQQRRRKDLFRISHPPTSETKKPRVEERSLCGGEGESPPLQQRRAQKFFSALDEEGGVAWEESRKELICGGRGGE